MGRQRDLWTALGVEADTAELMAAELELSFEESRLCVRQGAKVDCPNKFICFLFSFFGVAKGGRRYGVGCTCVPQVDGQDLVQTLATVLTECWRFRPFTESRWLTVGTSCRTMIVAVLLGLDDFWQYLKEDISASDTGIHMGGAT